MMTFEEWMAREQPNAKPLDYEEMSDCWHTAQAQCAAGPWQDIKDAPRDCDREVLVLDPLGDVYVAIWLGVWVEATDDRRLNPQPTHFARLQVNP